MRKEKDSQTSAAPTSRRRFAKVVAAALVAAPLASSRVGSSQTPPAAKESKAPPNPEPTPTPAPQPSREVARARFGGQVSDEEFKRITRDLEGNVRTAERLRAFKLQNSDEPDTIFGA